MAIPYEEYPRQDLLVIIIVQLLFMIIIAGLIVSLAIKYKRKNINELKTLMIFLILLEISTISAWIPKFMNYANIVTDLIYGVPVGGGKVLWWTNFSYIFNTASTIYLIIFTQQLFKIEKPNIIRLYTLAVIGFNIWSIYHGIFIYTPGSSSLTMLMSAYLIIISFYSYTYLYKHTKRDIKRLEPSIYRFGYKLIYYATLLSIAAYIYWVLSIILPIPEWATAISWIMNTFVMILLSLGLTLPEWLRKLVIHRYMNGGEDSANNS